MRDLVEETREFVKLVRDDPGVHPNVSDAACKLDKKLAEKESYMLLEGDSGECINNRGKFSLEHVRYRIESHASLHDEDLILGKFDDWAATAKPGDVFYTGKQAIVRTVFEPEEPC